MPDFGQCDGRMFLSLHDTATDVTTFYEVDTSTNPFQYTHFGSVNFQVNGTAFNPADFYVYGVNNATGDVIRVGSDGNWETVTVNPPLPAAAFAAEIGADGYMYVGGDSATLHRVDLTTGDSTTITMSESPDAADYAWHDGLLYAVRRGTNEFLTIDPSTGAVSTLGNVTVSGDITAAFGAPNGVYGAAISGGFYKFDKDTVTATRISGSPGASNSDGAKCYSSIVNLPADIQVTKVSDSDSYIPGQDVTYTITISNPNGPFGVSGLEVIDDPTPEGITNARWTCTASAGASCRHASGTGGIEGERVSVPVGGVVTFDLTMEVPPDHDGELVNVVTATNPQDSADPDPDNNTSSFAKLPAHMELRKTGNLIAGGNGQADANEEIEYSFTIENTGGVKLTNLTVSDPMMTVSGSIAELDPGASGTLTARYTLTQADIDLGRLENQATAHAQASS
ncbi:DUF6923 family protein, partial [Nitratireductor sp. GCM10026969]